MTLHTAIETAPNIARLRGFVSDLANLIDQGDDEGALLAGGKVLLKKLIATDDWLPEAFARPSPERYQQYLLHCDSAERFSVVSFVWGPGQSTPIHDHTVWGLVGILRGAERVESYIRKEGALFCTGETGLQVGEVEAVSPTIGDIHRVTNGFEGVSVSIHVYGANIGAVRRSVYTADGGPKPFISGYANSHLPNLWDRSKP